MNNGLCKREFFIICIAILTVTLIQGFASVNDTSNVEFVHVIFMNHLDVGYDGIASEVGFINNILNKYFHEYFPRAVNLSEQLRAGEYVENFVYTTHPWLLSLFLDCPENFKLADIPLQCPNETEKEYFEAAIRRGDITWHAGPMNMQLENMNELLFQMSLNISFELDKKYGIKRLFPTLSQRDVPGLTQAVIPSLVQRGISAVSVGVNPGSSPPAVPPLFRWSFEDDEVMATWHPGGYPLKPGPNPAHPGGLSTKDCVVMKGFEHALCFAFISDNGGPPKDILEILGYYEILRKEFPNAKIKGSTFEEYFGEVDKIRNRLPIIREEVGDTWIQGIASDPFKMASYRAISEAVTQCISADVCKMSDPDIASAVRLLIKLPEHTWGLPSVGDNVNWSNPQFNVARSGEHYKNCEKAWQEQRAFLWMAMDQLRNVQVLYDMIVQTLSQLVPQEPNLSEYEIVSDTSQTFTCEDGMKLKFQKDGSIQSLYDPYNMVEWATGAALGQFLYFTYNETDFMDMASQYNYYGGAGYDKKNSTQNAHPESRPWPTVISQMYKAKKSALGSCDILLKLVMVESKSHTWYGAPESVWLHYKSRPEGYDVTLQWTNKTPTRLAESIMYNFNPAQKKGFNWRLSKVGHLVDPGNVILNGSQYVHAVDNGVYYINNIGQGLQLLTQDVPLVSIATKERPPSPFPVPLKPISQKDISGMAFNLYNNIWDTNYILWYPYHDGMNSSKPGDFKARFQINFYVP
ncbi:uncharacterized protein LOC125680826 isoform X2 [Ostrea edulis]|uniref:uncharacterized protein LOC125680826 isoform X2 n=1 Tax=Ostrea edulis TaxID=37623 RepID=UPI002095C4F2|nr:uncharacterized protein LOC125680826 isoform X2 [Ostrea edulis]